jgi:hypothetical protein
VKSEVCWLPELEQYNGTGEDWKAYEDMLFAIFKADFIDTKPQFCGKPVNIRFMPVVDGKAEAFYHVTCCDYHLGEDRYPDYRRCERIRWVRSFIENYNCDASRCSDCEGVKIWQEKAPKSNNQRIHLLLEEERYMVIIELREAYNLLITAFYIDQDHSLRKQVRHYLDYINK